MKPSPHLDKFDAVAAARWVNQFFALKLNADSLDTLADSLATFAAPTCLTCGHADFCHADSEIGVEPCTLSGCECEDFERRASPAQDAPEAAAIVRTLAEAGCRDGYCVLRGPASGMHTNSGCRCLDRPAPNVKAGLIKLLKSLREVPNVR